MSFNVEYNNNEINVLIIKNILKMLNRRNLIDDVEIEFNKLQDLIFNNKVIQILLNNNNNYYIYIILPNQKLMSIVQGSPLDDFLLNNIEIHKIVIGYRANVVKKIIKQILYEYKNSEFFFANEMFTDIPSTIFISNHEIIINDERKEILSKFSENHLSQILSTDFMIRYYNAKIGDIIKITRPSITSGKNICYRKVIYGSIDVLFT